MMLIYVLDTSAITDPRLRSIFNVKTLDSVVYELTRLLTKARVVLGAQFYITPSTGSELRGFLERNGVSEDNINLLFSILIVKSPDLYATHIPARVMSNWIQEVHLRFYKGLRVAEEMVRQTAMKAYEDGKIGSREKLSEDIAGAIHELRAKYREATRKGVIDTQVDFDSVILAKELGAVLVTNDEGIQKMCEDLGVKYIEPPRFISQLMVLLRERVPRRPGT
ncbi:RNA ligase partner protein [Desulfurococcaceae archaeon MEX13E-LK6-19]|nr:RNA ligase partner protein [Desulfurococcaceae archaeon MEX13E-LK6-19]